MSVTINVHHHPAPGNRPQDDEGARLYQELLEEEMEQESLMPIPPGRQCWHRECGSRCAEADNRHRIHGFAI